MRLAPAIDLGPVRAAALVAIDAAFAPRLQPSAFATVWAEKLRSAEQCLADGSVSAANPILEEAELRKMRPRDLALAIRAASEAETDRVMAIEMERQRFKARIAAALDQHAVFAIVAEAKATLVVNQTESR